MPINETHPRKTKRFCLRCKCFTWFKYNMKKEHSRCTQCDGWMATEKRPKEDIKVIKKRLFAKVNKRRQHENKKKRH